MKVGIVIGRMAFTVVFFIAVGLAGYGFWSFQKNLTVLDEARQENILWPAMRLEIDLMRFNDELQLYGVNSDVSASSLNQRFDVLWSKVDVFTAGKIGARLRSYSIQTGVVQELFQDMQDNATSIENIDDISADELLRLVGIFSAYTDEMRELTKAVFLGEQDILSGTHTQLRRSANTSLWLSLVAVFVLLLGLGYSSWQSRRFRKLAEANENLAKSEQSANQAKTRFLTMMSHELRTPMNGVLGLLALLRQSTSEPQNHIIDQAERSSQQMLGMLTDILDFSALQNDEMQFESKSFELVQLADALRDLFGPEAVRAGIGFSSDVTTKESVRLNGDFRRLKQVSAHLVGYFVDLAGLQNIALKFDYDAQNMTIDIELDYGSDDTAWSPDLIFGERNSNDDSFMADALGPAVARGLIAKMNGQMLQKKSDNDLVVIGVQIPLERVQLSSVKVWMDLTSDVMASICRSSLRDTPVQFVTDMNDKAVNIVLFETGSMDEAARVAQLQVHFPHALIVAIGRPINAELFDFAIPMPAQISERLTAVIRDMAS